MNFDLRMPNAECRRTPASESPRANEARSVLECGGGALRSFRFGRQDSVWLKPHLARQSCCKKAVASRAHSKTLPRRTNLSPPAGRRRMIGDWRLATDDFAGTPLRGSSPEGGRTLAGGNAPGNEPSPIPPRRGGGTLPRKVPAPLPGCGGFSRMIRGRCPRLSSLGPPGRWLPSSFVLRHSPLP